MKQRDQFPLEREHDMDARTENSRIEGAPHRETLKLLLPVDATERSRWGINYALWRMQSGYDVAVSLLLVAEAVTSWQVLRFRGQEEVRRFQAERGRLLLDDAAKPLEQAGIPTRKYFQEGDIAFQILDAAEQLGCDEIVLPLPYPRWVSLFSVDIVRSVAHGQRSIPVVAVNPRGRAAGGTVAQSVGLGSGASGLI
jgi:hypothetical protein